MRIKVCIKNAQISIVYGSKKPVCWNDIYHKQIGPVNYIALWVSGYEHAH